MVRSHIRRSKRGRIHRVRSHQRKQLKKFLPEIKKIHNTLTIIKRTGEMPRGKAWMYSGLKNQGLIRMQTKKTQRGGTIFGKVRLTEQGRNLLSSFRV